MAAPRPAYRIGIDTGGTFTDLVLADPAGRLVATHKLLSTPADPSGAVLRGIDAILEKAGLPPQNQRPAAVVHGSTVATNALLEGAHANAALITTPGFEDTLAIARQNRPELYALVPCRPDPPIPRDRSFGVPGRLTHTGAELEPLDEAAVERLADRLDQLGVEAVAVCLLHSYANPAHERRIAEVLRGRLGPEVHLTVSHELLPEYREYERSAACAINAVVAPRMRRYLGRLTDELGEPHLAIMASHGGTLPPSVVNDQPIRTILSGPAGGVLGAAHVGRACGHPDLITLDMGGTSTDVALIRSEPAIGYNGDAAGLPIRLPMVDMHTVGAGGGSIGWLDPGGALRVGPRSAGADPGPACYGRQREAATVTDAHVVLGHIAPDAVLGQDIRLDPEASHDAVRRLADAAGLTPPDTARGVLRVAEATMARAIQHVTLQRGHDPRDFAFMPFGGAGGLHACRLADQLGITAVLLPPHPGLLSAVGMLTAPPRRMFSQSILHTHPPGAPIHDVDAIRSALDRLSRQTAAELGDNAVLSPYLDLRYEGQSYEITLPLDESVIEMFHMEHRRLYGYEDRRRPIEIVTARLMADGPTPTVEAPPVGAHTGDPLTGRIDRSGLGAGAVIHGPAVLVEYSATALVPEGWRGRVHDTGTVILQREGAS